MSMTTYSIHPSIGVARVGDSTDSFYLSPDGGGEVPLECDPQGNPTGEKVNTYKDSQGRIRRQAARFRVMVYDNDNPQGRPLKIGDTIQGIGSKGKLVDIEWTAYPANKKAAWYEFAQLEGEHGYAPDHPLRNAHITDPGKRQALIIDPGPQTINCTGQRRASFAKGENPLYSQTFPPALEPYSIDTLGEMMSNDSQELIFLGGYGRSGSLKSGFGEPSISTYANNDGWFDDTSDGPVYAKLKYYDELDQQYRYLLLEDPAWVITGYPRYAPELMDMITYDEVVYDLMMRYFATDTHIYGTGNWNNPETPETPDELFRWRREIKYYNPDYYPLFYRDIWPILERPFNMQYVTTFIGQSFQPHNTGQGGNFDLSMMGDPSDKAKPMREYIYNVLRQPGEENEFYNRSAPPSNRAFNQALMPMLAGDNPITNTLPSKFLRMTNYQLFILAQWAEGKFINDKEEGVTKEPAAEDAGRKLDRGSLANVLGGAFCPGGEVCWILRNPAIYKAPYRLKASDNFGPSMQNNSVGTTPGVSYNETSLQPAPMNKLSDGLEPGDLTKYSALPWQSDFNECSSQLIDITYEDWNQIYPGSTGDKLLEDMNRTNPTLWWPVHRPMQVTLRKTKADGKGYTYPAPMNWALGIPQNKAGDLKMVTEWSKLGFVVANTDKNGPGFVVTDEEPSNLTQFADHNPLTDTGKAMRQAALSNTPDKSKK
ncbi:LodA/GoxA family CTQ-dependent oxidase [Roseivirga sp. BDSF3-8]|uniref:LodA/GoxA family CTQ-dependent oxidase n=1 Tax=Roseivirga sp. BDSF3-8 TaxID=3241598 RepID=UPI003531D0B0